MDNNQSQFLVSTIVNGNEVKLYRTENFDTNSRYVKYDYFIHWGLPNSTRQSIQQLLTPSGRRPSQAGAHKQFLAAVRAARQLTFSTI